MTLHPQVHIQVGDREADVDEGIASLILELWRAGIDTVLSCQENRPGIIWICFVSIYDVQRFLNIVARYRPSNESLYNRALARCDDDEFINWEYDLLAEDWNLCETLDEETDTVEETHCGPPRFHFWVSVRFHCTDYPVVLRRMIEHNQRRGLLENKETLSNPCSKTTVPTAALI